MKPENTKDNLMKCTCGSCPLYSECNKSKMEGLFCARTISTCDMDNTKMCICGNCPIYSENDLSGGYFCINEIK